MQGETDTCPLLVSPVNISIICNCLMQGDFYSYGILDHSWQLLSEDTRAHGGPHLLYDHQMTFDPSTSTIYVFGGRVLTL